MKRMPLIAGLVLFGITFFGSLTITGVITPPEWVLWAGLIASGSMIYTTIHHRGQSERFTLTMTMILLALPNLTWPAIGVATMVGVSLGQLVLARDVLWYKRVYTAGAVSVAGVCAELFYSSVPPSPVTFVAAALIFDVLCHTFFSPIWLWVAGESLRDVNRSYWLTLPLTFGSIAIAGTLHVTVETLGVVAIVGWAVLMVVVARPEWTIGRAAPFREPAVV